MAHQIEIKVVPGGYLEIECRGSVATVVADRDRAVESLADWFEVQPSEEAHSPAAVEKGRKAWRVSEIVDEVVRLALGRLQAVGIVPEIRAPLVEPRFQCGPCSLWQLTWGDNEGKWVAVSPDGHHLLAQFRAMLSHDELKGVVEKMGFEVVPLRLGDGWGA